MDRKLSQPEILDVIFDFVRTLGSDPDHLPWAHGSEAKRDLASIARTCKTFRDPALDILWRRQTSLRPALLLFPEDLWVSRERGKRGFKEFRREIVPSDWERPVLYFGRVRCLVIDSYDQSPPDSSYFMARLEMLKGLLLRCPTSQLFPNLQQLQWLETWYPTVLPVLETLSAPRLTTMGFSPGWSEDELDALRNLGNAWPDLTDIVINHSSRRDFDSAIVAAIHDGIRPLSRLRSFDTANINAEILLHLSRLPHLRSLSSYMAGFKFHFHPDVAELSGSVPAFPALEEISGFISPEILIQILSAMGESRLTSIDAYFFTSEGIELPKISTTTALYTAIADHCSPSNLTRLYIEDDWVDAPSDLIPDEFAFGDYAIRPDTLQILKPFTNLTMLTLESFHGFDIDDATVLNLAQAWTKLEKLSLGCVGPNRSPNFWPHASMLSLEYLAFFCRQLKDLRLLFNATETRTLSNSFDRYSPQHTLRWLSVDFSPVGEAEGVRQFLKELFPSLNWVSCEFNQPEDEEEMHIWDAVSKSFSSAADADEWPQPIVHW
ncbi:hypothetical protein FB45DRAFT_830849 [Roridomyces roridus]|uniref:F-box domain-containing protein n=1 Tax=Roridomyces roridus TaxID=1738132 RepID=A0AAD7C036_9AGAR|nr:hypothetical protein FB45DRAFT_830849 [Roridomyces roridus]